MTGLTLSLERGASLDAAARARIVALCSAALETDCGSLFEYLTDAVHVLATDRGSLVGHACWTTRHLAPTGTRQLRTAWVDAVTVQPERQRMGVGTAVMRRVADATASYDLRALGTERIGFFERLGWEPWTGPQTGVLHDPLDTLMVRRTPSTPDVDTRQPIATG